VSGFTSVSCAAAAGSHRNSRKPGALDLLNLQVLNHWKSVGSLPRPWLPGLVSASSATQGKETSKSLYLLGYGKFPWMGKRTAMRAVVDLAGLCSHCFFGIMGFDDNKDVFSISKVEL